VRKGFDQAYNQVMQSQPNEQNFQSWGPETRKQMATMFDGPNKEIFDVTEKDLPKRFKVSPEYQKALQEGAKPPIPKTRVTSGVEQSQAIKQDGRKMSTAKIGGM
jgi:hypothetical protein